MSRPTRNRSTASAPGCTRPCAACVPGSKPTNAARLHYKKLNHVRNRRIAPADIDEYSSPHTAAGGAAPPAATPIELPPVRSPGPLELAGGIVGGAWDSASNLALGTVGGTWDLVTCGGPGAYSPLCKDFDANVRALVDPDFANQRRQAQLYALADAFGGAQANLASGDPARVSKTVFDVVLTVGLLGTGKAPVARGVLAAEVPQEGAGVVYRRIDLEGGRPYIGQAKSLARYIRRQAEHARANPNAAYLFEIG